MSGDDAETRSKSDAELDALREDADLAALYEALLRRGSDALDRGDWAAARRDLEEAADVATLADQPAATMRAKRAAAFALRADGRLVAANRLLRP